MNKEEFRKHWKSEEKNAHIKGWDFSHIYGRYSQADPPWDYKEIIGTYLKDTDLLLDIDTGGGEFLRSLNHPYDKTVVTEAYPPNVQLCLRTLSPLGIQVFEVSDYALMPFCDNKFDIIINRHGNYDVSELYRILKPNGFFITQQVGENNDRELVDLLLPNTPKAFNGANLAEQTLRFKNAGFQIEQSLEAFLPVRFFDIGALVWFAKIIEWEFPDFSVDNCFERLLKAQNILETNGSVDGTIHRYLIVAVKKTQYL